MVKTWGEGGRSFYSYINSQKIEKKEMFPGSFYVNTQTCKDGIKG